MLNTTPEQHRRRSDKTGLISWKANKYSVPLRWQRAQVGVTEQDGHLYLDLGTDERIATHTLSLEKGRTIKNNHHYRDTAQRITELEQTIAEQLPPKAAATVCGLLKLTSPRIYKDQLVGVRDLLKRYGLVEAELLTILTQQARLTASALQNYLEAWQQARERGREPDTATAPSTDDRVAASALQAYARLGRSSGQEVRLEQTQSQYRSLRLSATANHLGELLAQAEAGELSYLDFAQQVAEYELTERTRLRIARHLKQAQLPAHKPLEAFDYRHQTTITKRQVNALLDFGFIDERQNLVFIGPPGVGKTHLAIGIALKAIDAGYKVLFRTALALVEELELAEMKGELKKRLPVGQIRCAGDR